VETVRQWLVRHGQAPRLCELLWEPLALAALNQSIDHAAAEHFVGVLQKMFGPDPAAASIVLPAVPLDDLYAKPAREWLSARGAEVRLNAPAHVRVSGDRIVGVRIRDEHVDVPIVISAVPWFALPSIFEEPPALLRETMRHAADLESSAIVTVNFWFDRPIVDRLLIGLPGRAFQWVFDKGAIFENGASHLSLVASGASALVSDSNDTLVQRALAELRDAVPAARTATLRRASAIRERRATFSLAPDAAPRPDTKTAVEGFFLAGDWIDTGLPATIESAVVSGHSAAQKALEKLGTETEKH
jgi:hydroxysqualene dehydroxylase